MSLQLYFSDHSLIAEYKWALPGELASTYRVPTGCPVILDEHFWPLQPWTEFLRRYSRNVSANTARAYGRDLFQVARYFDSKAITWQTVTNDDLSDYRDYRLDE